MWEEQLVDPPIDYMLIFASFSFLLQNLAKLSKNTHFTIVVEAHTAKMVRKYRPMVMKFLIV